jgi:acylphosphatase
MSDDSQKMGRMEITVRGRVQGVGFRYFVVRNARRLGLKGWTMNMPDGSVFIVAEGPGAQLQELLSAVKEGPPSAVVSEVSFKVKEALNEPEGFYIR